jgi:signal transduction histidine kinase
MTSKKAPSKKSARKAAVTKAKPAADAGDLKTRGSTIEGAAPSFLDVDTLKREAEHSRRLAQSVMECARAPMLILQKDLRVQTANPAFYEMFHTHREETEDHSFYELCHGCWDVPELRAQMEKVVHSNARLDDFEVETEFPGPGQSTILLNASVIEHESDQNLILVIIEDITEKRRVERDVRELSGLLLQSQDQERRRIARELHDNTGQKVAAMSIGLAVLSQDESRLSDKARLALTECHDLAKQVSAEVRTLSYLLFPPLLEESGLASAMKWYADGFSERRGIPVKLELQPDFGRLPVVTETALFRVLQESLTNVALHAKTKEAAIRLTRDASQIELEVRDYGRGVSRAEPEMGAPPPSNPGVGIRSMRERMERLGGRVEITSGAGGTVVKAVLPVKSEP